MTLPYRYRGVVLLSLIVLVLPWAAWRFALRDTFGAWRDCRRLSAQLAATPAAESRGPAAAGVQGADLILSGGLLDTVRLAAAHAAVQVAGYEPLVTLRQDGLAVHTARLTLTGGCTALLRVVAELERALPRCRLRSMEWRTATDRRTRRLQLILTLYIQQIVLKE